MQDKLEMREMIDRLQRGERARRRKFSLAPNWDDVRSDLASCVDCTRERYRPTSEAASVRHSYDRISNTAVPARKRPLRYVVYSWHRRYAVL